MTREQLKAKGYAEILPGKWVKGNPDISFGKTITLNPPEPAPKRIRQSSKPLLNKLETEFLAVLEKDWPPSCIRPQAKRFKLGNGIWYKPDFTIVTGGKERAYEVKGPHAFRGGFENLKVFAHQWPEVRVILAWKENGEWKSQEVLP